MTELIIGLGLLWLLTRKRGPPVVVTRPAARRVADDAVMPEVREIEAPRPASVAPAAQTPLRVIQTEPAPSAPAPSGGLPPNIIHYPSGGTAMTTPVSTSGPVVIQGVR